MVMSYMASTVANSVETALQIDLVQKALGHATVESKVITQDSSKNIPANALDAKDFPTIDAWLDACIAKGVPGKIGSGTYTVDGTPRYAPAGIYGYGDTPPKFISETPDAWLYIKDGDITLSNVSFEGFGKVLVGAVALSASTPFHSTTDYAFDKVDTRQEALAMAVKGDIHEVGPDVTITNCDFINVESVFTFVSDTTQMGKLVFTDNVATGTWGLVDINAPLWTEVVATGNEWSDATGDRAQPTYKSNGVQTAFKIGTEKTIVVDGHYTKLDISGNDAHDIDSYSSSSDYNAAVFADVRGAIAKNHGDNSISFNEIARLKGLLGQEDSNAIYAKAWGLVIEGNHISESGADYVDDKRNGSETTGILVKPYRDNIAKDIEIINNIFENMPTVKAGMNSDLAVVKLSEATGNSSISGNTFIGGGNLSTSDNAGIIRYYGALENLDVVSNKFIDVNIAENAQAIVFNQLTRYGTVNLEVSHNSAEKTSGKDYTADGNWIGFTSKVPGTLVTGYNMLGDSHKMLSDRVGSPASPSDPMPAEDLLVGHVKTATNIGVELSDERFRLSDGKLYLKADYVDDLKSGTAIELVVVARDGAGWSAAVVKVGTQGSSQSNLTYSLTNVASVTENSTAAIKVATLDMTAVDAATHYDVSDNRFVVRDGAIYINPNSSFDYEKAAQVKLSLTAHIGNVSLAKDVAINVVDVNEAPTSFSIGNSKVISAANGKDTRLADMNVIDPDTNASFKNYKYTTNDARFYVKDGGLYLTEGAAIDYSKASTIDVKIVASDGTYQIASSVQLKVGVVTVPPVGGGGVENPTDPQAVHGTAGADKLLGTGGNDHIYGHAGNDRLDGANGNDILEGGAGADQLIGGSGMDTASYAAAAAGVKVDLMKPVVNLGDASGDSYTSIENLTGSAFDDSLSGDNGANILEGGAGNDKLLGYGGSDTLLGGAGDDYLAGHGGGDILNGGRGQDVLDGGRGGADFFVYDIADWGKDRIVNFEDNVDKIDMRGSGLEFDDLRITTAADGALITGTGGHSILLEQILTTQVTASDFIF